jgi:hypothetical protein
LVWFGLGVLGLFMARPYYVAHTGFELPGLLSIGIKGMYHQTRLWKIVLSHASVAVILVTQEADDQEDCSSKPAQANSSRDPLSKIPNTKSGWGSDSNGREPA